MKEERARTIYRKNYTPPNYRVTGIELEFKLYENETIVQSKLKIESLEKDLVKPNTLFLDGEQLELLEIKPLIFVEKFKLLFSLSWILLSFE